MRTAVATAVSKTLETLQHFVEECVLILWQLGIIFPELYTSAFIIIIIIIIIIITFTHANHVSRVYSAVAVL
jgi:hypothetical protein